LVLALVHGVDLVGVEQRAVGIRAEIRQQPAVDEPADHERGDVRLLPDLDRGAERAGDPLTPLLSPLLAALTTRWSRRAALIERADSGVRDVDS
jgi:hypothetical protein